VVDGFVGKDQDFVCDLVGTGRQCSCFRTGVMWCQDLERVMSWAGAF